MLKEISFSTTHEQKLIADKYIRIQQQFKFLYSLCDKQHNSPYSFTNWSYHGKVTAFAKSLQVFLNCLFCTTQVVIMLYTEDLVCIIMLRFHKSVLIWENQNIAKWTNLNQYNNGISIALYTAKIDS